jgi:hypothetical protein
MILAKNAAVGAANRSPASCSLRALPQRPATRGDKPSDSIAEREKQTATPAP